ncbi:MAG: response regulator [Deltaproteobacteria bacterium]|nr:response regulator [Deltaproteobacteria bacterium]
MSNSAAKNKIKVLIVEDEILIGLMLAKKLRSYGYDTGEIETTGEGAVERAGLEKPDVILMDVALGGEMNGFEAASRIKKECGTPIIIFSGYDERSLQEQIRTIEPVAVLTKMGPIAEMRDAIEKAVQRGQV